MYTIYCVIIFFFSDTHSFVVVFLYYFTFLTFKHTFTSTLIFVNFWISSSLITQIVLHSLFLPLFSHMFSYRALLFVCFWQSSCISPHRLKMNSQQTKVMIMMITKRKLDIAAKWSWKKCNVMLTQVTCTMTVKKHMKCIYLINNKTLS